VWQISIGIAGYFTRPLGWPMRILFAIGGILALIPAGAFGGAYWTDIIGVGIGVALIGYEVMRRRARVSPAGI
jgi:hypothetical protein